MKGKRKAPPPVRRRRVRVRELGKDLLILALAMSAVYLLLRTQMYAEFTGVEGGGLLAGIQRLLDGGSAAPLPVDGGDTRGVDVRPARIAVNLEDMGRYGVQYNQEETDRVFGAVFGLLGEALGNASAPTKVGEQAWRAALSQRTGVYLDFMGAVPLRGLNVWLGSGGENASLPEVSVRRLLLAENAAGGITLYYCNETDGMYYACAAAESREGHLRETLSAYSSNGAAFAFEKGAEYRNLDPYVLLGTSAPSAGVYRASNPVTDEAMGEERESLLTALDFHPQSNYSVRAGTRLRVREGGDDLTVDDGGQVAYHSASGETAKYPVGSGSATPTRTELAEATARLCEKTVGYAAWCGDARVYLLDMEETEPGVWRVDYGYSLNGAAVRLGSEGYAARFLIRDGHINDFYLNFRSYGLTAAQTTLLPELLSAAAMEAMGAGGAELSMVYMDAGSGDTVGAEWIAWEG